MSEHAAVLDPREARAAFDDVVLRVEDLTVEFSTDEGDVRAVDGVSLEIPRGKTLGVVGESGCGKSVTAMSIMRLIPMPPGRFVRGRILYEGKDLTKIPDVEMRALRGNRISMIFQEPMTSLNPVFTVGDQIGEVFRLHRGLDKKRALKESVKMLRLVGIPAPEERVNVYPHQLSGGMRQRVMIAMALACRPDVLIADEPTTALDVTIQAQILTLIRELSTDLGTAVLFITHDLGVIAGLADEVAVLYAGRVVERAPADELFARPQHPYTQGLLRSVPRLDGAGPLVPVPGSPPSPSRMPTGCAFHPRCALAKKDCREQIPDLYEVTPTHEVRCPYAEALRVKDAHA